MWKTVSVDWWIKRRISGISAVQGAVEEIVEMVRSDGDDALRELTARFDGITLDDIRVDEGRIESAYGEVEDSLVESLIETEARISRFHEMQMPKELWLEEVEPGIVLGIKTTPLERIGAYVPGGRAAYPTTALMCAVPARVAGVSSICCCTPPPVHPATLVAMDIAGVDEVYSVGGAQAVAAMAIGTESIRSVQKIVGPGNVYVTMAKMMLRDHAEIDFPAGPSEIAILADESGNARYIAADILAQAEHDPDAGCLLITNNGDLAGQVGEWLEKMITSAPRNEVIAKSMENTGYIIVDTLDEGVELSNEVAAEHLSLQVSDPLSVLGGIRNAGSIFIGKYSSVACGDYASGTNHVLPTAGYARLYSGLDVNHFLKNTSVQVISREGLESIGDIVEHIARTEGLHAHAESIAIRRKTA